MTNVSYLKFAAFADVYVTRPFNGEPYSGEDTMTNWYFDNEVSVVEEKEFHDLVVPFNVEYGKDYYAVYVIYSTGDSFSRAEQARCEFIDMFESKEKAQALIEKINEHYHDRKHSDLIWTRENGSEMNMYVPWIGYFESMDMAEVLRVVRR